MSETTAAISILSDIFRENNDGMFSYASTFIEDVKIIALSYSRKLHVKRKTCQKFCEVQLIKRYISLKLHIIYGHKEHST